MSTTTARLVCHGWNCLLPYKCVMVYIPSAKPFTTRRAIYRGDTACARQHWCKENYLLLSNRVIYCCSFESESNYQFKTDVYIIVVEQHNLLLLHSHFTFFCTIFVSGTWLSGRFIWCCYMIETTDLGLTVGCRPRWEKGDFFAIFGVGLIARVSPPTSAHLTDAIKYQKWLHVVSSLISDLWY